MVGRCVRFDGVTPSKRWSTINVRLSAPLTPKPENRARFLVRSRLPACGAVFQEAHDAGFYLFAFILASRTNCTRGRLAGQT